MAHLSPRGTAEIELLLVIIILLIPLLLLTAVAGRLGAARLANVFDAENDALRQVEAGQGVVVSQDPVALDGIGAVRPGLPNRLDIAEPQQVVPMNLGRLGLPPVTLVDKAAFLDPAWHIAAAPHFADQSSTELWFETYVGESHPRDLIDKNGNPRTVSELLGLAPSWYP